MVTAPVVTLSVMALNFPLWALHQNVKCRRTQILPAFENILALKTRDYSCRFRFDIIGLASPVIDMLDYGAIRMRETRTLD